MRMFIIYATTLLRTMEAILDGFDDSPESDPAFNVLATFNNEVRHCMCTLDAPADDDDFHAACDAFAASLPARTQAVPIESRA